MNIQKKTFGQKVYPWLLVTLPILVQYPIGPLDLDVIVMLAFFVGCLLFRRHLLVTPLGKYMLGIIGYIVVTVVINLAVGEKFSSASQIVLRAGRYCLYLFIVFFQGNESVDYKSLMRAYRVVAYAATIYVILQTVAFYGAGITLPNKLGGSSIDAEGEVGRLRSFYSEPSVMGYSLVPFIACSLLGEKYKHSGKGGALDAMFVSIGIILSTSGQGILATAVVWVCWLLIRIKNRQFQVKELVLLLAIAAAAVILYKTGILEFALDRAGNTDEGGAIDARMSGYMTLRLLSPLQLLFGTGFGNYVVENLFALDVFYEFVNYSSIAEFLFTLGIVGTALWVVFFGILFRRSTACVRVLILAMVVLGTTGCPMTGIFFPLWVSLMCVQLPEGMFRPVLPGQPQNP